VPNTNKNAAAAKSNAASQVTAGYKVIDRYQLSQPFACDLAGAEAWHAVDFALDRPVSVLLLTGPAAEAGAEAARRAALISDSRLTKIIDVGALEIGGQTRQYIVTEPIAGPTLEQLVSELPLDSATTRSIIGELANALDEADQRGLHHVALRPNAVRVNNGRVMLTGLGLDAELGAVNPELGNSERQDAVGLAALAYYALSGYWPLPIPGGDWRRADLPQLPLAPRTESGAVVPLRALVPDADPALLALADDAFGENPGHLRAPHAVAAQLAPWAPLATHPVPANNATASAMALPTGVAAHQNLQPHAAGRKSVKPGQPEAHPRTGRIPRAGKQVTSVVPDEEPLHIRPVEELDRAIAGPQLAQVYRQPKPPRPSGVRATPIVLCLALAGLVGSGFWAFHNVVTPFLSPLVETHTIEPDPPAYTAAPGYQPGGQPEPTPATPTEVHPVVVSGLVVDPYGDGERAENAITVTDGDPSTFWYTYTYASPQFGGLKPGVGFYLELQDPAPVSSVTLYTNGTGGTVEVRETTVEDPSGGRLLGTKDLATESTIDFGGEVELGSIMLWFTDLPQLPDGRYRLELREVTVR